MAVQQSHFSGEEVVILVHGTYAARDADEGDSWWQRGSVVWQKLAERLPPGIDLRQQGQLFHWCGENSERGRIKAARDLLGQILQLESKGQSYHLIGHSHGGSVIWHSLRMATLQKNVLGGLRSWSTVGTPFLHHRTRSPWHFINVVKVLLAIGLIKPAMTTLGKIAKLVGAALFGTDDGFILPSDGSPGWITANKGTAAKVVEFCGVPMTETAEGLRVGTFDPSGGQTIVEYVFLTTEGWLILVIALAVAYIYLNLAKFCISPVLESLRIRAEERLERKAMDTFQGRWLGLWSPEDEAINGLRATLHLTISFVSRMSKQDSVLVSDRLDFISRPHYWLYARLYNALCRPILDRTVRSRVVKTAQGNNRPSAEVVAISPAPVDVGKLPQLPDWLDAKLVETANQHAIDITPKLRRLLAAPCFSSGLETFGSTLSGRELIHTSYFDHDEILDLLAMHVALASGRQPRVNRCDERTAKLRVWLKEFKSHFANQSYSVKPQRIIPRRRAA